MVDKERLTHNQLEWLTERGGRTPNDVFEDKEGFYVLMRAWGADEKVYLPTK